MKANVPITFMLWYKSDVTSPIPVKLPWVYIGLTENRLSSLAFRWNFHMTSSIRRLIFKGAAFPMLLVQPENNILEKYHLQRWVCLEHLVSLYAPTCVLAALVHLTAPFSRVHHTHLLSIGEEQIWPGFLLPVFMSRKAHSISTRLRVLAFPTKMTEHVFQTS